MPRNEGKACHAVIKVLEAQHGQAHSNLQRPERTPGMPPIELLVTIGKQRFALEHTLVEALQGQIEAERDFLEFVGPLKAAIGDRLPIERIIYVRFPVDTKVGRSNLAHIQQAVASWIREAASRLSAEMPHKGTIDNNPRIARQTETREFGGMKVHIWRDLHWNRPAEYDGRVSFMRYVTGDIEGPRKDRIATALSRKLRKLHDARQHATTTILVLENNDIALTSQTLISQALALCFADPEFERLQPDAIFQVDTFTSEWRVYGIKTASGPWLHEKYGHDNWKFAEGDLQNLTAH